MNRTQEFLQSEHWLAFQEATGKEVVRFSLDGYRVNGIVHQLPFVGKYLYTPRWPGSEVSNPKSQIPKILEESLSTGVKWIRIDPQTEGALEMVRKEMAIPRHAQGGTFGVTKAPHDMQPRETFVIDITKTEEQLFAEMKPKVRYNTRLAEKRGVIVFSSREQKYQDAFFTLMEATAKRQHILPHPRSYYEKYFTAFPEAMCELWIAEYEGKVLAANLVMFYGGTATYLHGGTSDKNRDVMAPVFLQWVQICEAKKRGCTAYDFGGIKTGDAEMRENDWAGITRFKIGFSPHTVATIYPGSFDIIIDTKKYWLYDRLRHLQTGLAILKKFFRSYFL